MCAEVGNAASVAFKKALIERALGCELSHRLGYLAGATKPDEGANHRDGMSAKTLLTEDGPVRMGMEPGDARAPLERIVIERSLSINTAAAGGKASLMTIA